MGRQIAIIVGLLCSACGVDRPDCDEADFKSRGICVVNAQMTPTCFDAIVTQFHAWFPLDFEWYTAAEYTIAWQDSDLNGRRAKTFKDDEHFWTVINPYEIRVPSESINNIIKHPLVHELLHIMDWRVNGKFDEKHQHDTPGWFEVAYGANSLETQIRANIDWSCL